MSEKKVDRSSVAIVLGIICIILVAGLGVVLFVQMQNQLSSLEALKTEIESPNVSILTYSWQDSPYSAAYNLLSFNCTLLNTGFQTAKDVHVTLTIHYQSNVSEEDSWSPHDIPARQTAMMTDMHFVHNNTAIYYITIETDWSGGNSGNIVDAW